MVETVRRVATQPWEITAKNGDHFALKVGKEYSTSRYFVEGQVFVFSSYWVRVPPECFGMGPKEQQQLKIDEANDRLCALLREWLAGCPAPPEWHWSFDLNARTVNALAGTPQVETEKSDG
jgi:hypothetical protein